MVRLAQVLVAATFLLLIAGGLVTSTGSGLAVPDWPLSYGQWMPPMVGGVLFEHGHRMVAATVGLLTLWLAIWAGCREPRRWVRGLTIGALAAVVVQGILGGLTVLWKLPTAVSVAHGCLAQTFFLLVTLIATVYSNQPLSWGRSSPKPLRAAAGWGLAAAYLQLILGASLRHAGWRTSLILAHLAGFVLTLGALMALVQLIRTTYADHAWLQRRASWITGLLLGQVVLGLTTLASHRAEASGWAVWAATAHVAIGALLLAHLAVLLWHASRGVSLDSLRPALRACIELTKPRLTLLAVATVLIGWHLGSTGTADLGRLAAVLLGSWLIGAGCGALNQYLEHDRDALMTRTRGRPIPSGRLRPSSARTFGLLVSALGLLALGLWVNRLTALLGLLTLVSYLAVYTPMKTRTTLCTLVGAIPGALPPLMGWAAAHGTLDEGGWVLFALVFLWQLPHFLALAWVHREDYARAGFRMLPVLDPEGRLVGQQIALYCLALVPVSLIPTVLHLTGGIYFFAALALGLLFFGLGLSAAVSHSPAAARRLFLASITYLPGLLAFMVFDKAPL